MSTLLDIHNSLIRKALDGIAIKAVVLLGICSELRRTQISQLGIDLALL